MKNYFGALSLSALALLIAPTSAQNCSKTSTGLVPLTDMGSAKHRNFAGGLYGGGSNSVPAAHFAAGMSEAKAITPLDKNGKADAKNGRIVLISIGMSNTTQEFSTWVKMSDRDPARRGSVRVVDCAQGGQDARKIANANANYWTVCNQRLQRAGLSARQVQAAWIKQAIARPNKGFPGSALELQGFLVKIAQILKVKFPNIRVFYLSSRIYAGYATTNLNPEPFSYESGFSVQWTIAQQINGDSALNFDPKKGKVMAPWMAWGPYLWADGLKGRKIDKLIWECKDFAKDGTHPSLLGRQKVADLLDLHFKNDPSAKLWYEGPGGGKRAGVFPYGSGCPGSRGKISVRNNSLPILGNRSFALGVLNTKPSSPVLLFFSGAKGSIPLDPSCTLLLDPSKLLPPLVQTSNRGGSSIYRLPIPNDQNFLGVSLFTQFLILDAQAPGLKIFGGAAMSEGIELRLGKI